MKAKIVLLLVGLLALARVVSLPAQQEGYQSWNNIHSIYVRGDFTDANASGAQTILVNATNTGAGLIFYLPANQATTYRLDCDFAYSQATQVADTFGITFSVAPTNTMLWGTMATNATAFASLAPVNITSTANTAVVTGTPAVSTVLGAAIHGYVEIPSGAAPTSVTLTITQATAADVIVIKRDSGCTWHSML